MQSCKTLDVNIDDLFREVTKMITLGSRTQLFVVLFNTIRYAEDWADSEMEDVLGRT